MKRTAEARDNLLLIVEKFPDEAIMRYNLACYCCQMGNLANALAWLQRAFKVRDQKQLKLMALADPDLEPISWPVKKTWTRRSGCDAVDGYSARVR